MASPHVDEYEFLPPCLASRFCVLRDTPVPCGVLVQILLPKTCWQPFNNRSMSTGCNLHGLRVLSSASFILNMCRNNSLLSNGIFVETLLSDQEWSSGERPDGDAYGPSFERILLPMTMANFDFLSHAVEDELSKRSGIREDEPPKKRQRGGTAQAVSLSVPSHNHVRSHFDFMTLFHTQDGVLDNPSWLLSYDVPEDPNVVNDGCFHFYNLMRGDALPDGVCQAQSLSRYQLADGSFQPPVDVENRGLTRFFPGKSVEYLFFPSGGGSPSADHFWRFAPPIKEAPPAVLRRSLMDYASKTGQTESVCTGLTQVETPGDLIVNNCLHQVAERQFPCPAFISPLITQKSDGAHEDPLHYITSANFPTLAEARESVRSGHRQLVQNWSPGALQQFSLKVASVVSDLFQTKGVLGVPEVITNNFFGWQKYRQQREMDPVLTEKYEKFRKAPWNSGDDFLYHCFLKLHTYGKLYYLTQPQLQLWTIVYITHLTAHDPEPTPYVMLCFGAPGIGKSKVTSLVLRNIQGCLSTSPGYKSARTGMRQYGTAAHLLHKWDEAPEFMLTRGKNTDEATKKFYHEIWEDGGASSEIVTDALDPRTGMVIKKNVYGFNDGRGCYYTHTNDPCTDPAMRSRADHINIRKPGKDISMQRRGAAMESARMRDTTVNPPIVHMLSEISSRGLMLARIKQVGIDTAAQKVMSLFMAIYQSDLSSIYHMTPRDTNRLKKYLSGVSTFAYSNMLVDSRHERLQNLSLDEEVQLAMHMTCTSKHMVAAASLFLETGGYQATVDLIMRAVKDLLCTEASISNAQNITQDTGLAQDLSGIFYCFTARSLKKLAQDIFCFLSRYTEDQSQVDAVFILDVLKKMEARMGPSNAKQLTDAKMYSQSGTEERIGINKKLVDRVLSSAERGIIGAISTLVQHLKTMDGPPGMGANVYTYDEENIVLSPQYSEILNNPHKEYGNLNGMLAAFRERLRFQQELKENGSLERVAIDSESYAIALKSMIHRKSIVVHSTEIDTVFYYEKDSFTGECAEDSKLLRNYVKERNSQISGITISPSVLSDDLNYDELAPIQAASCKLLAVCADVNPESPTTTIGKRIYCGQSPVSGNKNSVIESSFRLRLDMLPANITVADPLYEKEKALIDTYVNGVALHDITNLSECPFFTGASAQKTFMRGDNLDRYFYEETVRETTGGAPVPWITEILESHGFIPKI